MLASQFPATGSFEGRRRRATSAWQTVMRTIVVIVLFMPCAAGQVIADSSPFDWSRTADGQPFVAAPSSANSYGTYSPTIYPVGEDVLPSDTYNPSARTGNLGIRTGHDDDPIVGPEIGQSTQSPVGEPFVLLAFVALFAAFTAFRRKVNS